MVTSIFCNNRLSGLERNSVLPTDFNPLVHIAIHFISAKIVLFYRQHSDKNRLFRRKQLKCRTFIPSLPRCTFAPTFTFTSKKYGYGDFQHCIRQSRIKFRHFPYISIDRLPDTLDRRIIRI